MRDALGTHTTQVNEATERLHSTDRKQVTSKELEAAIEAFNHEVRKYTEVAGKEVDEALKVLTLKKLLQDKIKVMLQTADLTNYQDCMNYVVKQARVMKNEKAATEPAAANGPTLDSATKDHGAGNPKDDSLGQPSWTPEEEEQWMMMMKGGGKGKGRRGPKGPCYNCGKPRHFPRDCTQPPAEGQSKGTDWPKGWSKCNGQKGTRIIRAKDSGREARGAPTPHRG